jgi:hypothetical protein
MLFPPHNQLSFAGFGYAISDIEQAGPDGATVPLKRLTFIDRPSGLVHHYLFSKEEFANFVAGIQDKRIIEATNILPAHSPRLIQ